MSDKKVFEVQNLKKKTEGKTNKEEEMNSQNRLIKKDNFHILKELN